jgi:hypothetical protein
VFLIYDDLLLVMVENDHISYSDYISKVSTVPDEYKTYELFIKNKGKVSKRIVKEGEWLQEGIKKGILPKHWK